VRRFGQSYAHPLIVLVILEQGNSNSRFAVTAGASIGNAVKRNRAKRLLRAALRDFLSDTKPGFDGVLIARKALIYSTYGETKNALSSLLLKAGILDSKTDG
jgi:ribonuclease P protein component